MKPPNTIIFHWEEIEDAARDCEWNWLAFYLPRNQGVGTDGMDGKRGRTCCCSTTTFFSLCRLFLSPESALPASVPNWWFDADYSAQYRSEERRVGKECRSR